MSQSRLSLGLSGVFIYSGVFFLPDFGPYAYYGICVGFLFSGGFFFLSFRSDKKSAMEKKSDRLLSFLKKSRRATYDVHCNKRSL